ncbi:MAG: VCBS repeat-containing protein [Candidatus Deferrimicrobiaceae bacterium]
MGKLAARLRVSFAIAVLLAVSSAATAADYPRRIAIAPFSILGPAVEIRQTVDILPRLVSSRLMAMAGAEVLLIPSGNASPENAAKEAGLPLLLKGSVAKLGAGYSIDVTVKDLATGQPAGAFFTAAATEDEIIPRLGDLAADISEKLFGVKAAVRVYPTPPSAPPLVSPPAVPAPAVPAGTQAAVLPPPQAPASPPPAAALPASVKAWEPSVMEKVAESGRITDELHGVVSGDMDSEGNGEVIAYGRKGIYLYRVSGKEILAGGRITEGIPGQILNLEAVDLDGDGAKEIVVTGIDGENLRSQVLKKKGETYGKIADRLPYFLVLLPDWKGKEVVAGQQQGDDFPFHGRLYAMIWDGKTLRMGEALPADTLRAPLSSGILGLSSAKVGEEWKWIYMDKNDNLRLLAANGETEYKTGADYGWSGDSFEWGIYLPRQGKTKYYIRKAARVSQGPDGKLLVLVPMAEEGLVNLEFSSKTTRLVLLQWDGGELIEKAGTRKGDRVYSAADFLSPSNLKGGGMAIASVIEQPDGVIKGGISRLVLFRIR